jgi:hypothetical protein
MALGGQGLHEEWAMREREREASRSQKTRSRMENNSKRVNIDTRYRNGSKREEDPEIPPEPQDLRLKLGRKRERERQERREHHVYDDAETEELPKGEEVLEKPKFKRHHSRSKSKGEEPVEYASDDSKRKQKRKHRKHYEDSTPAKELDSEPVQVSRKLKSKGGGASNPTSTSIEVTRWQLVESEQDEGHSNHHSYNHSKRKSQRYRN